MKSVYYSKSEERANIITHALGFSLSIVGAFIMLFYAFKKEYVHVIGAGIFLITLITMYLTSTLYHFFQNEKLKSIFRKLDHIAIYLLIAGTYTPFTLITLKDNGGFYIFLVVWGLAIFGIIYKMTFLSKYEKLSLGLYLLMGWLVVFVAKPMMENLNKEGIVFIVLGGLFYTLGVVFYAWEKLPFNHAIWHVFVLLGSFFHFLAIFYGVIL